MFLPGWMRRGSLPSLRSPAVNGPLQPSYQLLALCQLWGTQTRPEKARQGTTALWQSLLVSQETLQDPNRVLLWEKRLLGPGQNGGSQGHGGPLNMEWALLRRFALSADSPSNPCALSSCSGSQKVKVAPTALGSDRIVTALGKQPRLPHHLLIRQSPGLDVSPIPFPWNSVPLMLRGRLSLISPREPRLRGSRHPPLVTQSISRVTWGFCLHEGHTRTGSKC